MQSVSKKKKKKNQSIINESATEIIYRLMNESIICIPIARRGNERFLLFLASGATLDWICGRLEQLRSASRDGLRQICFAFNDAQSNGASGRPASSTRLHHMNIYLRIGALIAR